MDYQALQVTSALDGSVERDADVHIRLTVMTTKRVFRLARSCVRTGFLDHLSPINECPGRVNVLHAHGHGAGKKTVDVTLTVVLLSPCIHLVLCIAWPV